ncbi:MAG TPA: acyl-CoA thioesterase [Candidatus Sulfotelmatobacter sp.]|nr:acyl-CoA thioesterase [Candidatus Sulfotelmatobacter sp.]
MAMPAPISAEVSLRVPFHHVDPLEVVWHGHYVEYFEQARAALLDQIDYNYAQMRDSGYAWPVIELFIRYPQPMRYGQRALVRAALREWKSRLKIDYTVQDAGTGRRLTTGYTVQVAVSLTTGEMCFESPPVLYRKLGLPFRRSGRPVPPASDPGRP